MSAQVTFATYAGDSGITTDDQVLRDALMARDIEVQAAAWDDPFADWSTIGLCLLRSTWDYHLRCEEFLVWANHIAAVTRLWNPLPMVRWNAHKRYLRDLAGSGVASVPTQWLIAGLPVDLPTLLEANGWSMAIIKPGVGASAEGVALASSDLIEEGQAHLDTLLRRGDVMVQPFLPSVRSTGERSLIVIDGEVTHAWRRHSPLDGTNEDVTRVAPEPNEIALAHAALAAAPGPVLYDRVGMIHDQSDRPLLSELELIEPYLALQLAPDAAALFADAIARILRSGDVTAKSVHRSTFGRTYQR
ncbi:MAG: hypothetical protein M3Z66_01345 [Chloroflexota bacterium]|nr:hypothetical protein [Chloroflexota bacterium]